MKTPQYPQGLSLDIHAHKVDGGNDGRDILEIDTLDHYIGMAPAPDAPRLAGGRHLPGRAATAGPGAVPSLRWSRCRGSC